MVVGNPVYPGHIPEALHPFLADFAQDYLLYLFMQLLMVITFSNTSLLIESCLNFSSERR